MFEYYHDRQNFQKLGFKYLELILCMYSRRRAFSVGAIGLGSGISNWTGLSLFSINQSIIYGRQISNVRRVIGAINIIEPFCKQQPNAI